MNSFIIAGQFIKRFIGDKKKLLLFFLVPTMIVAVFMSSLMKIVDRETMNIIYINQDQSRLSDHLVKEIEGKYALIQAESIEELREAVINQRSMAGFVIPQNFSETLLKGEAPQVDLFDLNVNEVSVSLELMMNDLVRNLHFAVVAAESSGLADDELATAMAQIVTIQEQHAVYATSTDFELYVSPNFRPAMGMLLMFMLLTSTSAVALIMEDRQLYTMSRMYSAPVRIIEITAGNFLGSFMVGTLQVICILTVLHLFHGSSINISFWPHLAITEMFLLAAIGAGMAIGSLVKTHSQLSMMSSLVIFPTCMLGGCFWPIWMMADYMQKLADFIPQKWALDAMEKLASGAELQQVGLHAGVLVLFAVILLGIGSAVLNPAERQAG